MSQPEPFPKIDYHWFYPAAGVTGNEPSPERLAQTRTDIVDGSAAAEHWVFRQKDIRNWWSNPHHDRPGGTRSGSPTAWVPESKPVIFTELGCPAVDKGANQPNVFFDPKSSESFVHYFSSGARDDAMPRAFLEVFSSQDIGFSSTEIDRLLGPSPSPSSRPSGQAQ